MAIAVFRKAHRAMIGPMSSWSRTERGWIITGAVFVTMSIAGWFAQRMGSFFQVSDAKWYFDIAAGHTSVVIQPFASRQLGPLVVRMMAWLGGGTTEHAFIVQGIAAMLVLLAIIYARVVRTKTPRWLLVALMVVPFWFQLFGGLVLPDLWYACLLGIFLVLVEAEQYLLAACMMFPLMVSRESTLLTLACFIIAGWRRLHWKWAVLSVVAGLAGSLLVQRLTMGGPGNVEHLPQSVYMLTKAPWNFARNVLGLVPWSNVYTTLCHDGPTWQYALHVGPVRAIGLCGVSFILPLGMLHAVISTFGMLPLLVVFLWWRLRHRLGGSVVLRFCLIYGGLCFVLTPLLGTAFNRLFGYSWPLVLFALPMLFDRLPEDEAKFGRGSAGLAFLGMHFAACLLVLVPSGQALVAGILLNVSGFLLLRYGWEAGKSGNVIRASLDT